MARVLFSALFLVFLSCVIFNGIEARPLSGSRLHVAQDISGAFRVYPVGAAKNSGPSSPGVGHKDQNVQIMGDIKESGPIRVQGHKYQNAQTMGHVDDSGPSPGEGHKYQNAQTMGDADDSGPSRGEEHQYVNGNKP